MTGITRRQALAIGFGGLVAVGVGVPLVLGIGGSESTGTELRSGRPLPKRFSRDLPIPNVLRPSSSTAQGDRYDLVQREGTITVFDGVDTRIWGYNGTFPGPTIRTARGRETIVNHSNRLPVPTVAHLHGGRTPAEYDGYPLDFLYPSGFESPAIERGSVEFGNRDYRYPMDQRAATLWYHDHRMDFTGVSVWMGLAGFHIVTDDEEDALPLPRGDRDIPLMITDRAFDASGQLTYPSLDPSLSRMPGVQEPFHAGVLGDVVLVNGTPWPVVRVDGARYRLRILNGSNARRYRLALESTSVASSFTQIGSDGGLLAAPVALSAIEIAPAERFDVIVDFSAYAPGSIVTLVNEFGSGSTDAVMRFVVGARDAHDATSIPDRLSDIRSLTAADAVTTRTLRFATGDVHGMSGWTINGHAFSPDRIEATVALGSTEVWRLVSDFHHPVHLHLSPFQVLSRGLSGPGEFDAGWKDTVDIRPAEEVQIAIPFDGYPGKYVLHCHNLEHEDMAMMTNFVTR